MKHPTWAIAEQPWFSTSKDDSWVLSQSHNHSKGNNLGSLAERHSKFRSWKTGRKKCHWAEDNVHLWTGSHTMHLIPQRLFFFFTLAACHFSQCIHTAAVSKCQRQSANISNTFYYPFLRSIAQVACISTLCCTIFLWVNRDLSTLVPTPRILLW